jgi:hypothetical protein
VRKYLTHYWSTSKGVDPQKVTIPRGVLVLGRCLTFGRRSVCLVQAMAGLPTGLKHDIMLHICGDIISKVPLFEVRLGIGLLLA